LGSWLRGFPIGVTKADSSEVEFLLFQKKGEVNKQGPLDEKRIYYCTFCQQRPVRLLHALYAEKKVKKMKNSEFFP
jgi:hypothetical protein